MRAQLKIDVIMQPTRHPQDINLLLRQREKKIKIFQTCPYYLNYHLLIANFSPLKTICPRKVCLVKIFEKYICWLKGANILS